ncbi:MAG: hypothetical protein WC676_07575 [Candidatus Omnitrophota bacterium]
MSIINEALKKTQDQLAQKIPQASPSQQPSEKNPWIWGTAVLVGIGFLSCGLIFFILVSSKSRSAQTPTKETQAEEPKETNKQGAVTMFAQPQPPAATEAPSSSSEALVLNGIITMEDGHMALINNQIYKAGEYIGEKRVVNISVDKVEILDKGEIITLTTKN